MNNNKLTITLTILSIFAAIFTLCCDNSPKGNEVINDGVTYKIINNHSYIEVKYMLGANSGYYAITHDGDCKNSIHFCTK